MAPKKAATKTVGKIRRVRVRRARYEWRHTYTLLDSTTPEGLTAKVARLRERLRATDDCWLEPLGGLLYAEGRYIQAFELVEVLPREKAARAEK